MNAVDYLRVAPFINDCPNCGNGLLGNGEGTLNLNENIIERTCKCKFEFKYDVNKGTSKKKIKQAINEALTRM